MVGHYRHIAVDLLNRADCDSKLVALTQITPIFSGAYVERPTCGELVAPNLALLVNSVKPIERVAKNLHRALYPS